MSDSGLAGCTVLSPNTSGKRTRAIERITIHCVVGQCTAASLGAWFSVPGHWSSNYGVGRDGSIGLYVPEDTVSQCSSSYDNDNRAVTIETASDNFYPYAVTEAAFDALLDLCEDVCRRNGKTRMVWLPTKEQRAAYQPGTGEMLMTVHRDYANKSCPGEYLYSRMGEIAEAVNRRLAGGDTSSKSGPPGASAPTSKEENDVRYDTIEELPEWGRETVAKLCKTGIIKGRSGETDAEGCPTDLDLSVDMLRLLVMLDRAGALEREVPGMDGDALPGASPRPTGCEDEVRDVEDAVPYNIWTGAGTTPHQSATPTAEGELPRSGKRGWPGPSPRGEASAESECGDACGVVYDDYTMIEY